MKTNKNIHNCLTYLANRVAETLVHNWDSQFSKEETQNAMNKIYEEISSKNLIDWDNLTVEDCEFLRFGKWSDDSDIMLIPIWLYKAIPKGLTLYCFNGKSVVFDGTNIDTDTRFGCLAWGIKPVKE